MSKGKPITLSRFIKQLQKLEAKGYGRSRVGVNKDTLDDGNDTFNVCDVHTVETEWVRQVDGDGFSEYRQDGAEKGKTMILLKGRWWDEKVLLRKMHRESVREWLESLPEVERVGRPAAFETFDGAIIDDNVNK